MRPDAVPDQCLPKTPQHGSITKKEKVERSKRIQRNDKKWKWKGKSEQEEVGTSEASRQQGNEAEETIKGHAFSPSLQGTCDSGMQENVILEVSMESKDCQNENFEEIHEEKDSSKMAKTCDSYSFDKELFVFALYRNINNT